jgi:hypothetical protein
MTGFASSACSSRKASRPDGWPGQISRARLAVFLAAAEIHSESKGYSPEPNVTRPQLVGLADGRPEEVRVDEPDSSTVESPVLDEHQNLVVPGLTRPRQGVEELDDFVPTCEGAAGEVTDHEWMTHDRARLQEHGHVAIAVPQVVDPNRCIDEDHRGRRSTRPAPAGHLGPAIGAAKSGELFGGFPGDQSLEPQADEFGFLADAGETGGSRKRVLVDIQGGSHASIFSKSYALVKSDQGARLRRPSPNARGQIQGVSHHFWRRRQIAQIWWLTRG